MGASTSLLGFKFLLKNLTGLCPSTVHPEPEAVMGHQFGSKKLLHEIRTSIEDMYDIDVKQRDIAEHYMLHRSTVSKIIRTGRIQESES